MKPAPPVTRTGPGGGVGSTGRRCEPCGLRSCHKTSLLEFLPGLVDPVMSGLPGHPFGEFGQPLAEVP